MLGVGGWGSDSGLAGPALVTPVGTSGGIITNSYWPPWDFARHFSWSISAPAIGASEHTAFSKLNFRTLFVPLFGRVHAFYG